jgi:putative NADPH-quinone reductase
MRVLYLYCHPLEDSLHGAIRARAMAGLSAAGHATDLLDLYVERFDPVLSAEERRHYHDPERNRAGIGPYLGRLAAAEALVVQFPTWCYGPPAMLKGFFDRVFVPGIAFDLTDPARVRPLLTPIRRITGIVTYGRDRLAALWMGDPPRRFVRRYLRWFAAPRAEIAYLALYGLNTAGADRRAAFLDRVQRRMARP